ncbi:hypothetical protein H9Q74_008430 [Fusarium xylarioides]|nr:hypothetical protein H9Q71_004076 [Fusarium xylarioides]KAG5821179.1 hypothetical protein H9Q74_008430 [Fusarium xylarioides]
MDARNAQIRGWINTGQHAILTDYEHAASDQSASNSDDFDGADTESVSDDGRSVASSTASTASAPIVEKLLASDNDALIPMQAEIDLVFQKGRDLWSRLVASARSLSPSSLSTGLNDPSIILKDVPALPEGLPKRGILAGRPLWHVPGEDSDLQHIHGARKHFCLSYPMPIECRVLPRVAIGDDDTSTALDGRPYPSGLLLLTLCWSYIYSVRFWELQKKQVRYTSHALQPRPNRNVRDRRGNISIHLENAASRGLVRWLCALLAPKPGWSVQGGGHAPWTAFCSGGAEFTIITDEATTFTPSDPAPSSDEAVELLIELSGLYGFGSGRPNDYGQGPLSPIVAGFVAVLALPFYRAINLQPQFLAHTLQSNPTRVRPGPIRQYAADLQYYMTLSMHPMSVGSIIWSVFWQPDVECNVASPWLCSILSVLRPLIDSGNLDILTKVFTLRRPRVALWWLGIFLLGNTAIPSLIVRYLETSEERWGYATMASPDTTVSSWTGSPQSFLDQETSRAYVHLNDSVSKADLLRCRYNLRLQDTSSALLSWQPFGVVPKTAIEPDLWPWLERRFARTYQHWVWYIKKGDKVARRNIQEGFRKDTNRFVEAVADCLDVVHSHKGTERSTDASVEPSREATLRMINYCMEDATGDRDVEISMIPGVRTHPWLKGWRGLDG